MQSRKVIKALLLPMMLVGYLQAHGDGFSSRKFDSENFKFHESRENSGHNVLPEVEKLTAYLAEYLFCFEMIRQSGISFKAKNKNYRERISELKQEMKKILDSKTIMQSDFTAIKKVAIDRCNAALRNNSLITSSQGQAGLQARL